MVAPEATHESKPYPKLEGDTDKLLAALKTMREKLAGEVKFARQDLAREIVALETALKSLQGDARKTIDELVESQRDLISKLEGLSEAVKSPPLGKVTFVRVFEAEGGTEEQNPEVAPHTQVEVRYEGGGTEILAFLDKDTDVRSLVFGQRMLIKKTKNGAIVVRALDEVAAEGTVGAVEEVLEPDALGARYIVKSGSGAPQLLRPVAHLLDAVIKKGDRVLADTAVGLLFECLVKEKSGEEYLLPEVADVTFAKIAGLEETKRDIEELFIDPILFPLSAKRIGRKPPKGVLLVGPPGVGKTMIAKATVSRLHQLRCEQLGKDPSTEKPIIFYLAGPELQHWLVGKSEDRFRSVVARARELATPERPVGIVIDEADSWLRVRGSGISSDVEVTNVGTFNAEVDGLEEGENVFFILLTNLEDSIDNAVKRPGRCDRVIRVPRQNKAEMAEVLRLYLVPTWGSIHPKYEVQNYSPKDREGKVRTDAASTVRTWHMGCDPKAARDYLVERTIERIFEESERNTLVRLQYEDGGEGVVRYRDLISGAIGMDIVERAKRFADRRYSDSLKAKGWYARKDELVAQDPETLIEMGIEPLGIQLIDLYRAIEQSFAELRVPKTNAAMRSWLLVENLAQGRDVKNIILKGSERS